VGPQWFGGTAPGSSSNVFIDNGDANGQGVSAVTLDTTPTISNLTIDNDDSLAIANANALTIGGNDIHNAGNMSLNSVGNFTDLVIGSASVNLDGGGTLTLSNNPNNRIYSNVGGTHGRAFYHQKIKARGIRSFNICGKN
jgi:hypothetical protein